MIRWRILAGGLLAIVLMIAALPVAAQEDIPQVPADKPFILPFDSAAGPDSWLLGQYYGNTTTAYRQRRIWYAGGQGLHFGMDFSAPCGTPVVAIGDGLILKVDAAEHGAGPHNLVILHDNGFASLYGHLNQRPPFAVYTRVEQGQVIGETGDPDLTCTSRPHLHLEVRDNSLFYGYNPADFIDADWDTLALVGPFSTWQIDLDDPRRWQTFDDQPSVQFGGAIINEFENPYIPGWR